MKNKNIKTGIQLGQKVMEPMPPQLLVALRNFLTELVHSGRVTPDEAGVLKATLRPLEEGILDIFYSEKS